MKNQGFEKMDFVDQQLKDRTNGPSKNEKNLRTKVITDIIGFLGIPLIFTLSGDFDIGTSVFCLSAIGFGMLSSYFVYRDTRSFYKDD